MCEFKSSSLSRFNNFFLMVRITSYNICKKIGECNELYTSFENYIFPIEMNILDDDMNRESGTKQHS